MCIKMEVTDQTSPNNQRGDPRLRFHELFSVKLENGNKFISTPKFGSRAFITIMLHALKCR